jgi:hypothetical protein
MIETLLPCQNIPYLLQGLALKCQKLASMNLKKYYSGTPAPAIAILRSPPQILSVASASPRKGRVPAKSKR